MRFCEKEILADRDLQVTRFGRDKCTSRRAITYHLPLRKRERIKRLRVTVNGKHVKVRRRHRAAPRARVAARAGQGALPDQGEGENHQEAHDPARPARPDLCGEEVMRLALAVVIALVVAAPAARSTPPTRRRTTRRSTSERRTTTRPSSRRCSRRAREPARSDAASWPTTRALRVHGQPVLEPGDGCAGDIRLYDWGRRATASSSRPVHRPQRVDAVRPRLDDRARARQAARRRDHQRLRAGAGDPVLVRRADAGQGRLRGDDLGPAGPGLLATPTARAPTARRLPLQNGRAVLRRHRGRAGLLLLDARRAVRPAQELHERARRTPTSRRPRAARAASPPTTRSTRLSTPATSASPATRSAPRASPTSASSTRA